jgi:hypothetical protein
VRGRQSGKAASIAVAASIIGSSLSKVTSGGTLIPLALAELSPFPAQDLRADDREVD